MLKSGIAKAMILTVFITALNSPVTHAEKIPKYIPIVDRLHVTETRQTENDMKDPDKPTAGKDDIPEEILKRIDTELHDDKIDESISYNGYYLNKDGEKTYINGDT